MKIRRTDELYELIEKAIDEAFVSKRFLFSMYGYLKGAQYTRKETTAFIESGTANTLNETSIFNRQIQDRPGPAGTVRDTRDRLGRDGVPPGGVRHPAWVCMAGELGGWSI